MLSEEQFPSKHLSRYFQATNTGAREKLPPIPSDVKTLLKENQRDAYDTLRMLGWKLEFVRREELKDPIFVFKNPKTGDFACIEENGDVTINPDIGIRVD